MAPGRKRPAVALSKVPSVTELCDRLGFERASPIETSVFTDTTHAFRKSYKCSNGSAGANLTDWYSINVQQELTAMASRFLIERDNGERFWSDSRRWKEDGDLTYPEDRTMIVDLLKQLFWKQNKYALNNQTYIEKKAGEARDQSRDNSTPTQETTQRASMASTATFKPADMQQRTYSRPEATPHNFEPKGPVISLLDDERNDLVNQMQSTLPSNDGHAGRRDIFEVPEDDSGPSRDQQISESTNHRPPMRTPSKNFSQSGGGKASASKKSPGESPSAKRPKIGERGKDKNQKKRKLISPRRTSDRPKAPRIIPETIPDEMIDDLLRIRPSDKRPTSAAEHAMHRTSNQQQQISPTEAPYGLRPMPATNYSDMRAGNHSNLTDNTQSEGNDKQRQESNVSIAPMLGTSRLRGSLAMSASSISSLSSMPVQEASGAATTPDPILKPKPKVRGLFWIVTSPEPNYSDESWNNGQIKGKSLPTVIEEISSITHKDCIEKLKIRLKTSFAQTTTTVHKDAEAHWETTKSNLEEKIREAFTRDRDQQVHFQIWIEPLYEQNAPMGGIHDSEKGEIDW